MAQTKVRYMRGAIKHDERQIFRNMAQQAASLLDDISVSDYLEQRLQVVENLRDLLASLDHVTPPVSTPSQVQLNA